MLFKVDSINVDLHRLRHTASGRVKEFYECLFFVGYAGVTQHFRLLMGKGWRESFLLIRKFLIRTVSRMQMGVHCSTSGRIHLKADRDITIDAHRNMEMRSPEQIEINKYGTPNGIDMSVNQVKIYSSDTHVVLHGEEPMPYPEERERDYRVFTGSCCQQGNRGCARTPQNTARRPCRNAPL